MSERFHQKFRQQASARPRYERLSGRRTLFVRIAATTALTGGLAAPLTSGTGGSDNFWRSDADAQLKETSFELDLQSNIQEPATSFTVDYSVRRKASSGRMDGYLRAKAVFAEKNAVVAAAPPAMSGRSEQAVSLSETALISSSLNAGEPIATQAAFSGTAGSVEPNTDGDW
ncbi:MAG: hypothetical protein AAGI28_16630, partial [Pseudomonadota bacterium]